MAWYTTGTIAISGTTVTGTGTNWTDNKMGIGPGQALLVPGSGTAKIYEILRVDSATKLTLTSSAGTVAAGSAYAIMSFYTDSVPDFARRLAAQLGYYQSQMDGWQSIQTGTGSITLEAPDGSSVTISSFKKLTDDMSGKMEKSKNLNDVENKATARTNLGLGTSAVLNTGSAAGNVMAVGAFGLGATLNSSNAAPISPGGADQPTGWGYWSAADNIGAFPGAWQGVINTRIAGAVYAQLSMTGISAARMAMRVSNGSGAFTGWSEFYTTSNTTKASDGTLKAASPVARIVKSRDETERTDIDEDDFEWCGAGTANAEAAGIEITRRDIGVYVITGAAGLAEEGWRLLPPRDPDGSGDLGIVEADESADGITVRLYKRRWLLTDDGDIEPVKGVPIDVPANSWIDVRLSMGVTR